MNWLEWWSFAVYDLHFTIEDLWIVTPAQLAAARERHDKQIERAEFGPAMVCYTMSRIMGAKDVNIQDWMPSQQSVHNDVEAPAVDVEAKMGALAEIFGGKFQHGG